MTEYLEKIKKLFQTDCNFETVKAFSLKSKYVFL